jgi:dihydroflavonol-4-reductase
LDVKPTSGQLIVTMAKQWVPFFPQGGKCFQDADDCAVGHILAMERGTHGQRYLLGNQNLSYREFMELVADVVGARAPRIPLPTTALWAAGKVGSIGSRFDAHRFAGLNPYVLRSMQQERYRSGARARDELGVPQTDMRVAVKKAYKWFKDHGYC